MLRTLGRILGDINNTRMDVNFTRGTKVDKQKKILRWKGPLGMKRVLKKMSRDVVGHQGGIFYFI